MKKSKKIATLEALEMAAEMISGWADAGQVDEDIQSDDYTPNEFREATKRAGKMIETLAKKYGKTQHPLDGK